MDLYRFILTVCVCAIIVCIGIAVVAAVEMWRSAKRWRVAEDAIAARRAANATLQQRAQALEAHLNQALVDYTERNGEIARIRAAYQERRVGPTVEEWRRYRDALRDEVQQRFQDEYINNPANRYGGVDYAGLGIGPFGAPVYSARWAEAQKRAQSLLLDVLSPVQRMQYDKYGHFLVIGSLGGRYVLKSGESTPIGMPADGVISRFCLQPRDHLTPFSDRLIAWKAWIEADELTFLRRANRFPEEHTTHDKVKREINRLTSQVQKAQTAGA